MSHRRRGVYFDRIGGAPDPVTVEVKRRVAFSDADMMGIVWFGRYSLYFEAGSAELGRLVGLSYRDFYAVGLMAPIAECHLDYHIPLRIDDVFTIRARMVWSESARINTEYELVREDGTLAASGYTVQMLLDANAALCLAVPDLLVGMREKWSRGEFR